VRTARKHIGWYLRAIAQGHAPDDTIEALRQRINLSEDPAGQLELIDQFFSDKEKVLDTCIEQGRVPK